MAACYFISYGTCVILDNKRSGRFPLELAGCLSTGAGGGDDGERFVLRRKETETLRRMKADSQMSWLEREGADFKQVRQDK